MLKKIIKILLVIIAINVSTSSPANANGVKRVYNLVAPKLGDKIYQGILRINGNPIISSPTVDRLMLGMMDVTTAYLTGGIESSIVIDAIRSNYSQIQQPYRMGDIHFISEFLMVPKFEYQKLADEGLVVLNFEDLKRHLARTLMEELYGRAEGAGFFKAFAEAGITFASSDSIVLINGKKASDMSADKVGYFIDEILAGLPQIEEDADILISEGKHEAVVVEIIRKHFQKKEFSSKSAEWIDKEKWILTERVLKSPELTKKWIMRAVALETLKNSEKITQAFFLHQFQVVRLGLLNMSTIFPDFLESPKDIERLFINLEELFQFLLELAPRSAKRGHATQHRLTIAQTDSFLTQIFGDKDVIPDEDFAMAIRRETVLLEAWIYEMFGAKKIQLDREIAAIKESISVKTRELSQVEKQFENETNGAAKDALATTIEGVQRDIERLSKEAIPVINDEYEGLAIAFFDLYKILQRTRQRHVIPGYNLENNLLNIAAVNAVSSPETMASIIKYFETTLGLAKRIHVGTNGVTGGSLNGKTTTRLF